MALPPPRRPRFLSAVPDAPEPLAPRFGKPDRPVPRRSLEPLAPAARDAPAAPTAEQLAEARREALEKVGQAVATLQAQAAHLAELARGDALDIGFQVARKILETEVRTSPEVLFALVKSAVRRAGDSRRVTLRVCPDDAARLQAGEGQAALDAATAARVEIAADASLAPGDCIVDTDYGQIDGRLDTRLGELRRALEGAAEGAA